MYKLKYSKAVDKFIISHPIEGKKILMFASSIQKNPFPIPNNVLKLSGSENDYRLRIGKYRLIYRILDDDRIIFFIDAGSRGGIYK